MSKKVTSTQNIKTASREFKSQFIEEKKKDIELENLLHKKMKCADAVNKNFCEYVSDGTFMEKVT